MTTNVTNVQPTPETAPEGHDEAMAKKFDDAQNLGTPDLPTVDPPQRPAWLPEKFKTVEDMAAAYKELEGKLGQQPPQTKTEESPKEGGAAPTAREAQETLTNAGIDFDALSAEFSEHGSLTEGSYAALEAKGFNRQVVDTWIAGQQAIVSQLQQQVYDSVGGAEKYNAMVQWAAQNLSPKAIDAYNAAMGGGVESAQLASQGLLAQYQASVGSEPALLSGGTSTGGAGFRSTAELTAAMADPRYAKDPAYREDVMQRLAHSNIL